MANDGSVWDSIDSSSNGTVKFDFENQTYHTVPEVSQDSSEEYLDSTADTSVANSNKGSSEAKAQKKKLKNDIYTLIGTVNVNPCSSVISDLKTAKTVVIKGVGDYLTGKYLIKNKSLSISSSGISVEIEVLKTGFEGNQLNGGGDTK